ncbi:benenodin family lasso peptide [Novosphingobium sp. ZW T3_23]|nr:benenodin family lasso peptide [Novosphingobium sp.]
MNRNEQPAEELADLGAIVEETKGGSVLLNDTNGPQQQPVGLSDD